MDGFVRKSTGNKDINIFLSLESPCNFLLEKEETWKRIFNSNSKIVQKNKLYRPMQQ